MKVIYSSNDCGRDTQKWPPSENKYNAALRQCEALCVWLEDREASYRNCEESSYTVSQCGL